MKRALLGILMVTMLVISGCGGGTVEVYVPPPPQPPSITLNVPTKDYVNEYIDGSVDFYAPDSIIDTITVSVYNSNKQLMFTPQPVQVYNSEVQGTILFTIDYYTYPSDAYPYTFYVYVTDRNGNWSNTVSGSFLVP